MLIVLVRNKDLLHIFYLNPCRTQCPSKGLSSLSSQLSIPVTCLTSPYCLPLDTVTGLWPKLKKPIKWLGCLPGTLFFIWIGFTV